MLRVLHVITGLDVGGAELFLARLLAPLDARGVHGSVVALKPAGPVRGMIEALGVDVTSLDVAGVRSTWGAIRRLRDRIQCEQPDVVQAWMYHGDLVGGLAALRVDHRPAIVWNVRQTEITRRSVSGPTYAVARACAMTSARVPDRIVCCSAAAAAAHARFGYDRTKMVVIRNGFESQTFRPDEVARRAARAEMGLDETSLLVGVVGRVDPIKGHEVFAEAMGSLLGTFSSLRAVIVGPGADRGNRTLVSLLARNGIEDRTLLLGERHDMPSVLAALDALVSPSLSEGLPNAVGEAMACGVPCIVTDVGDSAELIGSAGRLVPVGDARALSAAIAALLSEPASERHRLGLAARTRIVTEFSLEASADHYTSLYEEAARVRDRRRS